MYWLTRKACHYKPYDISASAVVKKSRPDTAWPGCEPYSCHSHQGPQRVSSMCRCSHYSWRERDVVNLDPPSRHHGTGPQWNLRDLHPLNFVTAATGFLLTVRSRSDDSDLVSATGPWIYYSIISVFSKKCYCTLYLDKFQPLNLERTF
jgi:hypothetical protein